MLLILTHGGEGTRVTLVHVLRATGEERVIIKGSLTVWDNVKKDVENETLVMSLQSALERSAHAWHKSSGCCRDGPGCYRTREQAIKTV